MFARPMGFTNWLEKEAEQESLNDNCTLCAHGERKDFNDVGGHRCRRDLDE